MCFLKHDHLRENVWLTISRKKLGIAIQFSKYDKCIILGKDTEVCAYLTNLCNCSYISHRLYLQTWFDLGRIYITSEISVCASGQSSDAIETNDLMFRVYIDPSPCPRFLSRTFVSEVVASCGDYRVRPMLCNAHVRSRLFTCSLLHAKQMAMASDDLGSEPRM